jgi:hypothetical protein
LKDHDCSIKKIVYFNQQEIGRFQGIVQALQFETKDLK